MFCAIWSSFAVIIISGTAVNSLAFSPPPFQSEMARIDSLFAKAASGREGLEELEKTVTRKDAASSVKKYALEKIGALATPKGEKFLIKISSDASDLELQHAARLAYVNSRVIREPSQAGKKLILIKTMKDDPMRNLRSWAAEELCDMGDETSLPDVRKTIAAVDPTPSGNRRIAVCESKVRLLAKHSAKINALKEALYDKDDEMRRWGIQQLGKLKAPEAETALVDFASGLQKDSRDSNKRLLKLAVQALKKKGWDRERLKDRGIKVGN